MDDQESEVNRNSMIHLKFQPFPVIKTDNFQLRQLNPGDASAIFQLRSSDTVNRYIERKKASSISDALDFIENISESINQQKICYWVITPGSSDQLVGTIGLFNINFQDNEAETGFELLPKWHGKGIMKEVFPAVIQFAFDHMNVQVINASVHRENIRSIQLLEKNNFFRSTDSNSLCLDYKLINPAHPDVDN